MYNIEPSHTVPPKSNIHALQDCADSNGMADVEDNSSGDEIDSNFKGNDMGCGQDVDTNYANDTDNLVCPGNVLEYLIIAGDQAGR